MVEAENISTKLTEKGKSRRNFLKTAVAALAPIALSLEVKSGYGLETANGYITYPDGVREPLAFEITRLEGDTYVVQSPPVRSVKVGRHKFEVDLVSQSGGVVTKSVERPITQAERESATNQQLLDRAFAIVCKNTFSELDREEAFRRIFPYIKPRSSLREETAEALAYLFSAVLLDNLPERQDAVSLYVNTVEREPTFADKRPIDITDAANQRVVICSMK